MRTHLYDSSATWGGFYNLIYPIPAPVEPFTLPTETPEEGLHFTVQDQESHTFAGTYREGNIWIAFEVTRGERNTIAMRLLNGAYPYESEVCEKHESRPNAHDNRMHL